MFRLQVIVDSCRPLKDVTQVLDAGADCLQVRIRDVSDRQLVAYVQSLADLCRSRQALLLVSGRADVAVATGAQGVQLGRGRATIADILRVFPKLYVGASVHSVEEAIQAEKNGADAVIFGHIFATPSHPGDSARGIGQLRTVAAAVTSQVVAIGGVNIDNVDQIRDAGADGIAVMRAIWSTHGNERTAIVEQLRKGMER